MLKLRKYIANKLNRMGAVTGAAFVMGMMSTSSAHATGTPTNSFNTIATNILNGINTLPGFLSGVCYMMGMGLAVLGILKIKDHVENPSQAHLKDGAIRLAVGGGLFMIPIITESMQTLIGTGNATQASTVRRIAAPGTLVN